MILGLELTDSTVRAVIVSDGGEIVARAEQGSSGGVGPAIRESVRRAQAAAQTDLSGVGVATTSPSDVLSREIAWALADAVP